ncbi:MAG: HTH-type transcriptional regulator BenM [Lentisphaerae bacterium ADurb.Bin242]|nr:MAG: HTH-type transcriptional regulator BenM [Lentisphaerae bacterium ADurb.Bin242]
MNITQLTYFKHTVDEMSVTKAARRLFVTQSAVSQQIALLSAELECRLFYRHGRSLQLTPEGEFLYQKAKNIIIQMEGLSDELKSRGKNVVGTVRIGSGPVTGKKLLPEIISGMLTKYPDVSFSLFEIHSSSLIKSIVESRIELGIGQIDEEDERIHFEKLMVGRLVLICSSQSEWSKLKSISVRALPKLNLIRRVREVEYSRLSKILQTAAGRNFQLAAMNTETIVPYVKLNMGMALAPDYIIAMMKPKGISQIRIEEEIRIPWGIMRDKFRPVSKAAQVFIDKLKQKLPF